LAAVEAGDVAVRLGGLGPLLLRLHARVAGLRRVARGSVLGTCRRTLIFLAHRSLLHRLHHFPFRLKRRASTPPLRPCPSFALPRTRNSSRCASAWSGFISSACSRNFLALPESPSASWRTPAKQSAPG